MTEQAQQGAPSLLPTPAENALAELRKVVAEMSATLDERNPAPPVELLAALTKHLRDFASLRARLQTEIARAAAVPRPAKPPADK